MTATIELIALVRADFLPDRHRAPRAAYHPDPQGTGWLTVITARHWMPPGISAPKPSDNPWRGRTGHRLPTGHLPGRSIRRWRRVKVASRFRGEALRGR